jgi:hypothetical protein
VTAPCKNTGFRSLEICRSLAFRAGDLASPAAHLFFQAHRRARGSMLITSNRGLQLSRREQRTAVAGAGALGRHGLMLRVKDSDPRTDAQSKGLGARRRSLVPQWKSRRRGGEFVSRISAGEWLHVRRFLAPCGATGGPVKVPRDPDSPWAGKR